MPTSLKGPAEKLHAWLPSCVLHQDIIYTVTRGRLHDALIMSVPC